MQEADIAAQGQKTAKRASDVEAALSAEERARQSPEEAKSLKGKLAEEQKTAAEVEEAIKGPSSLAEAGKMQSADVEAKTQKTAKRASDVESALSEKEKELKSPQALQRLKDWYAELERRGNQPPEAPPTAPAPVTPPPEPPAAGPSAAAAPASPKSALVGEEAELAQIRQRLKKTFDDYKSFGEQISKRPDAKEILDLLKERDSAFENAKFLKEHPGDYPPSQRATATKKAKAIDDKYTALMKEKGFTFEEYYVKGPGALREDFIKIPEKSAETPVVSNPEVTVTKSKDKITLKPSEKLDSEVSQLASKKQMSAQKDYLTQNLTELEKSAPDIPELKTAKDKEAYARALQDKEYYSKGSGRSYTNKVKDAERILSSFNDEAPKVTIKVPGDGQYTIVNTKTSLASFREKIESKFGTGLTVSKPANKKIPKMTEAERAEWQEKWLPDLAGAVTTLNVAGVVRTNAASFD